MFRENAHRYPAKSWYERIANAVGEDPDDLKFWGQVVFDYVGKGWNPTNVLNMLEFYEKGETPGDRRRGESDDRTIMLDDGWQPIEPDFVKPMTTVT